MSTKLILFRHNAPGMPGVYINLTLQLRYQEI